MFSPGDHVYIRGMPATVLRVDGTEQSPIYECLVEQPTVAWYPGSAVSDVPQNPMAGPAPQAAAQTGPTKPAVPTPPAGPTKPPEPPPKK